MIVGRYTSLFPRKCSFHQLWIFSRPY